MASLPTPPSAPWPPILFTPNVFSSFAVIHLMGRSGSPWLLAVSNKHISPSGLETRPGLGTPARIQASGLPFNPSLAWAS